MAEPDRPVAPGGESMREFQARGCAAVETFRARHPDATVVVFTHGGFIGAVTYALMGITIHDPRSWVFYMDNTGITEWMIDEGDRHRLVRLNDTAHLASLA